MFDAEIAATLLNRWEFKRANPGDQSPLDLLREGKLHFKHKGGHIQTDDPARERRLHVEYLTFTDDSRASRVTDADGQGGWSRWTAAEPIRKSRMSACKDHVDVPCSHSPLPPCGGRRPHAEMAFCSQPVARPLPQGRVADRCQSHTAWLQQPPSIPNEASAPELRQPM